MFTLILKNGRVMVFAVREVAELYSIINIGSTLICDRILEKETA